MGEALVSIEEFFCGNSDPGSVGCNLAAHPGLVTFASVLAAIRERDEVQTVLISVTDLNTEDAWPFCDRVYIITSAPPAVVKYWVQSLLPDEVDELAPGRIPLALPELQLGQKPYLVWWD